MKAKDIRKGDLLKLKRDRIAAYGNTSPLVRVDEIIERDGYKTPWIMQVNNERAVNDFYAPSDFEKRVNE